MSRAQVEQAVGPPGTPFASPELNRERFYYQQLAMRVDFDDSGRCDAVEFLSPAFLPPSLVGRLIAGPTLRAATETLWELGHEPWTDRGPLADASSLGAPGSTEDTVYFHDVGMSLCTEMGTQTDAGLDLGEYRLDTVLVWRPGYWHEANERWTQQGLGLRVALPG